MWPAAIKGTGRLFIIACITSSTALGGEKVRAVGGKRGGGPRTGL